MGCIFLASSRPAIAGQPAFAVDLFFLFYLLFIARAHAVPEK